MNVRQVQKSIVPILLLQLIGEIFFFFFFVHIIMDDSRERLAVFSWSLCGSLVIHGGWWWSVGKGLVWSLRGADENQNTASEQTVKGFNSHRSTDDLNIIFLRSSTSFILHVEYVYNTP